MDKENKNLNRIKVVLAEKNLQNKWLAERISLLDEYFDYDPDGIKDLESAKHSITQPVARKVIRDRHLYIIRDNETYSVDGKWVR